MKAYLVTYLVEQIVDVHLVEISDEYDGDCYGDSVPFSVGSNQSIVTKEDEHLWGKCEQIFMQKYVENEVAKLRSMGWQRDDFAKALKELLAKEGE